MNSDKSASWCSYFGIFLICLLQLNDSKIYLFLNQTTIVSGVRHTPQHRLTTRHRQHILFIIFRFFTHCCRFHPANVAMLMLLSLLVKDKQQLIKLARKPSIFFLNNFIEKPVISMMSIMFSLVCVTSLFWLMLACVNGVQAHAGAWAWATGCWLRVT